MEKTGFFIRIFFRNVFTNRKFVWINITGLSIGVTVSLIILLYVRFETTFENFNPRAKNIYRIIEKNRQDGSLGAATPLSLSDVLKRDYPEIDRVVGLMRMWEEVRVGEKRFDNLKGALVERDFFDLFNFPLKSGNPSGLFDDPFEAVLTEQTAAVLFGDNDPLGRTFRYGDYVFTVSGVIGNMSPNSIFNFDYLLSGNFRYRYYPDLDKRWYDFGLFTFITFKGNSLPPGFEKNLSNIEEKYFPDFMKNRLDFIVTRLRGSHLNPELGGDLKPGITPGLLWILSAIAAAILVIACLNFMNISVANASRRNISTAVKKVNGATVSNLISDFFSELTFLVCLSIIISLFTVYLLLPFFNKIVGKEIIISPGDPVLWIGAIGFALITILISGIYPSLVLARPSPVKILMHNRESVKQKITFQKSFVVLQFIITIVLGITQLFIFKQISFMQNHSTGFNKKDLITIPVSSLGNNSGENERLKKTLLFVQEVEKNQAKFGFGKPTVTEFVPGFGFRNQFKIFPDGDDFPNGLELLSCDVDENFPEVFGMHIVNGRYFSKDYSTDNNDAIILNETAFKRLGWNSVEDKSVGLFTRDNRKRVVGVINDINVASFQLPVRPMIYQFGDHHNYPGYITVRINETKEPETLEFLRDRWEELFPGIPFGYESISDRYTSFYGAEKKLARITGFFSVLAIILSLLGIFALSTLEADKRIKEIGIRKINGAKTVEIIMMLDRYFIKWVAVAFLAGGPAAMLISRRWLQGYAYRTELSWWIFALAGFIILGTAILTVSWQSWRAATRNPADTLRYE
jgi:putative ABC transport system permease protein